MAEQQKKKGSRAAGRNKLKAMQYASASHQSLIKERKLRRILKSSGPAAAREWASGNGALHLLQKIALESENERSEQGKIGKLAEQAHQR